MQVYQITHNSTCTNAGPEQHPVSGLDCVVRIFLCLQMILVKIDDNVSDKTCLICEEPSQNKVRVGTLLNKPGL